MEQILLIGLGLIAIIIFFKYIELWLSLAAIVGYIANLFAVYEHWHYTLSVGRLAELIGIIVPPLGVITGWIHIFS